jgi:hypothetical protein
VYFKGNLRVKKAWVMSLISDLFVYPVPKQSDISVDSRRVSLATTDAPGDDACLLITGRITWIWTHQRTTSVTLENKPIHLISVLLKLKTISAAVLRILRHSDTRLTDR